MTGVSGFVMHPGHDLMVTGGGPFGRAWVDCSCGFTCVYASKHAANRQALLHHHGVGGCNCPDFVTTHRSHPAITNSQPEPAGRTAQPNNTEGI